MNLQTSLAPHTQFAEQRMQSPPLKPVRAAGAEIRERDASQGRALLAARYTEFLLESARRKGIDCAALFGDEPVFATRSRHALWNHKDLGVVVRSLRIAANDENWGLIPDVRVPVGTFRFACELFPVSGTLNEALKRAFALYDLMGGVRFELQVAGDLASIVVLTPPMAPADAAFVTEWWLWLWHYVAQWFVRSEITLTRVEFPHEATVDPDIYDGTFGSHCSFGADTARMVFRSQDLARPVTRALAEVAEFFDHIPVSLNYVPNVERSVTSSLKVALLTRLHGDKSMPTLEELAHEQGVTGQTLRRWLAAEQSSYRRLKAEVRNLVARHHLSRSDVTLLEVATRAGFAETSAFTRAFRKWTGMNVSQYREAVGATRVPGDEGLDDHRR